MRIEIQIFCCFLFEKNSIYSIGILLNETGEEFGYAIRSSHKIDKGDTQNLIS
jgi:hypothetical protein